MDINIDAYRHNTSTLCVWYSVFGSPTASVTTDISSHSIRIVLWESDFRPFVNEAREFSRISHTVAATAATAVDAAKAYSRVYMQRPSGN